MKLANQLTLLLLLLQTGKLFAADSLQVSSPDKKITVTINTKNRLSYTVSYSGALVLQPSSINLWVRGKQSLADKFKVTSNKLETVDEEIISPVPEKRTIIRNHYNQLTISFAQPYSLQFRVFDDGVAYRIVTRFKDSIIIENEEASFSFEKGKKALLPLIHYEGRPDRFHTSFEELYQVKNIDSLSNADIAYTPLLAGTGKEVKVAITESDLLDYPGMFISGNNDEALHASFAPYPLETKMTEGGEFSQEIVTKRADYIAKVKGYRTLPWRVLMIAAADKDLPGNDMVYRLATPSKIADPSWINPGKGTDEWIIGINLFNIPFKAGLNTATYKYYIDFAKQFGFQRIMMDAGWSNYQNLLDVNPSVSMDTLAAYAKEKGIKISMWTLCSTLDKQLEPALNQFNKWGVDFIMTDFMDRDDQPMVNFYERIAKACADHKIMIMFHGAYAPKGFNRTWPNNITREGVLGSEYNIWSDKPTPEHDLTLPFTRMLAGPFDYEPGILDNATKDQFHPINKKVMTQGTRCHQLAMFVVYDSPIQIFSGNPSQGLKEPDFMKLMGDIPTTWDETKILEASVGDYIVTARRKGDEWFIGGMTDWTERTFELPLNFLDAGTYQITSCIDGVNADNYPSDYLLNTSTINNQSAIKVKMAQGGGFVFKLVKKKD